MLYAIIGERVSGKRKQKELADVLKAKQKDAELVILEEGNFTESLLDELIVSQGLFSPKYIVVLDNIGNVGGEIILSKINEIGKAPHAFILVEEKLNKEISEAVKKNAQKIFEVKDEKKAERNFADSFALAEAFGRRDKARAWELFIKEKDEMEMEKVHGGLFWQMKTMMIASKTKSVLETDLKDYPYRKAKELAKNYKAEEMEKNLFQLVKIYHNAHRGGLELDLALEKLILEI